MLKLTPPIWQARLQGFSHDLAGHIYKKYSENARTYEIKLPPCLKIWEHSVVKCNNKKMWSYAAKLCSSDLVTRSKRRSGPVGSCSWWPSMWFWILNLQSNISVMFSNFPFSFLFLFFIYFFFFNFKSTYSAGLNMNKMWLIRCLKVHGRIMPSARR